MTAASAAQLSDRSSRQRPDEPAGLQEGDRDPLPDGTTAGKPDPRIPARPDSDVARARASRPATALIWRDSFFSRDAVADDVDRTTLRRLRWMLQKEALGQDVFLVGPPGPAKRRLAASFAQLVGAEVQTFFEPL